MLLASSAEAFSEGFTIIIDNRHGNMSASVKKLLSAAEVVTFSVSIAVTVTKIRITFRHKKFIVCFNVKD